MSDFKVVYDDLSTMAKTFHDQAGDYRKLRPDVAPPVVSGGDAGLDSAIKEVADLIIALHIGMADRLDDHGDKVAYARDSFHRHDVDVHGVFEDLMG
ncbi:hypothetical protein J2Z21_004260 [Streptomyces griseochromogenes]|uniref:PE domain-containing protein n=1 Tax=Streptomyces griseochromogenes TaxID=68214 RepID=A0A1B1AVB2_9ACTN|nr:DUF6317 family protein [Streptomyces griseochromogenes]ANP50529.1 hypothetical protein AVL59_13660 [Streptomyces griseochromogenes]MBP2051289.1 hypothetical protein [Streptomyces griseochromogenes]